MATRSTIAIELPDGTVSQVYCHWDGYLDHNGRLLLKHYNSPELAAELIYHGDISSLKQVVGEQHDFDERFPDDDPRSTWTNYYGRDRGEEGCGVKSFKDFEDYKANHQYEEYEYIMRKGEWYVAEYGGNYLNLADRLVEEGYDSVMEMVDDSELSCYNTIFNN